MPTHGLSIWIVPIPPHFGHISVSWHFGHFGAAVDLGILRDSFFPAPRAQRNAADEQPASQWAMTKPIFNLYLIIRSHQTTCFRDDLLQMLLTVLSAIPNKVAIFLCPMPSLACMFLTALTSSSVSLTFHTFTPIGCVP